MEIEKARALYGAVSTFPEFLKLQEMFLRGDLSASYCHAGPLHEETQYFSEHLVEMLHLGFITDDSQNGHTNDKDQTMLYGFGYISGYLNNQTLDKLCYKLLTGALETPLMLNVGSKTLVYRNKKIINLENVEEVKINVAVLGKDTPDPNIWDCVKIDTRSGYDIDFACNKLHSNVAAYIEDNFTYVDFVYPATGDKDVIIEVLKLLQAV
jgi:hypothetical protein